MEKMLITGVAADRNTVRISAIGVKDEPGIAFKIFNTLAKNNINVDIILQSVGRNGTKDISFTVSEEDLKEALAILEEKKEVLTIKELTYSTDVANRKIKNPLSVSTVRKLFVFQKSTNNLTVIFRGVPVFHNKVDFRIR